MDARTLAELQERRRILPGTIGQMSEPRQVCQSCRSLIDPDATRCPNCGDQPYPSRSNVMIVGYIVGALLILCLIVWFFSRV